MVTSVTQVTYVTQYDSHVFMIYAQPMAQSKTLTTERYHLLLGHVREEYVGEHGHDHGWKKHAADLLGVHRSMVSSVWGETKGVGARSAEKATKKMRLPAGFFMDPGFDARTWLKSGAPREESRVELVDDHPQERQLREFEEQQGDRFPDYVYRMIRASEYGRHGLTEGQLLDAAKRYHAQEEEALNAIQARLGPPKRTSD